MRLILASALALGLAACAGALATVAADVNLIATGLNAALSDPAVEALIPPAKLAGIEAALLDLKAVAAAVAAAPSASAQQASVATVEADVNTIVAALAGLPLPAPATKYLAAAEVLLPVVETAVGIVAQQPPAAARLAMSPDEARAVLSK